MDAKIKTRLESAARNRQDAPETEQARRTFWNSNYNNHGCTMSVTVDEDGVVISSTGCSWAGHEGLADGWADGMLVEPTGDDPEGGDWQIVDGLGLND